MTKYGGGGADDTWGDDNLMIAGNSGYTYTIPSCLADGFYLVRHEIIAVFVASSYPGAQLYPGCHQLNVTGGGSTTVSNDLVAFPGAYTPTDPGIVWDSSSTTYPVPGPSVFSCSGSSGSDSSASAAVATATATASASSVAATSAAAAVQTSDSATTLSTAIASSQVTSSSSAVVEASSTAVAVAAASVTPSSSAAAAVSTSSSSGKTCSKKRGLRRGKRDSRE